MRLSTGLLLILICLPISTSVFARDTLLKLPVSDVLNDPSNASRLEGVKFYFGDEPHPEVTQSFGTDRTNKKTNAFGKSDVEACKWVMLSALVQLHQRAIELGANAVINIKSNYKNNETSSATEYVCGAGALMAGVAFIGEFVVTK
jgi:hypothetical protein